MGLFVQEVHVYALLYLGDSLTYHSGMAFSTKEDNRNSCAVQYSGSWWYKTCYQSSLNGVFNGHTVKGISWNKWKGKTGTIKKSTMMIRIRNV